MPFLDEAVADQRIADTAARMGMARIVITPMHLGRPGAATYNDEQKVMIGVMGNLDGTLTAAKTLGVPKITVESFTMGKNTAQHDAEIRPDLKNKIDSIVDNFRDRLAGKACAKIEKVLDTLDDERINGVAKATDLASIANSLANVTSKLAPILNKTEQSNNVHFHFFRPRTRNEDEYQVIEAGE